MTEERDPLQAVNAARDVLAGAKEILELLYLAGSGEGGPTGTAIARGAILGQEALELAEGTLKAAVDMLAARAAA